MLRGLVAWVSDDFLMLDLTALAEKSAGRLVYVEMNTNKEVRYRKTTMTLLFDRYQLPATF